MLFITLNVNSLQSKTDVTRDIAKLTNATVTGLSETKLDRTVLSSELEIEGYDLVKFDRSQRAGVVACFIKNSISYDRNQYINTDSIFIENILPKSKPVLIEF